MNPPTTPIEAVALALALAIIAPSEAKAHECVGLAEQIIVGAGLSEHEVAQAKKAALILVDEVEKEAVG